MSILERSEADGTWARRLAKGYGVVTGIALLFSLIYEYNSHGVYSPHMMGLALYPLVGGVLIFSLLAKLGRQWSFHWFTIGTYQAVILTFMFGSLVKGVLDIYGTSSWYASIYWWVGGGLAVICAASAFLLEAK